MAVLWRTQHPCWSGLHGGCLAHHFYLSAIFVYKEHLRFLMSPVVNVWDQVKNKISIFSFDKYSETIIPLWFLKIYIHYMLIFLT